MVKISKVKALKTRTVTRKGTMLTALIASNKEIYLPLCHERYSIYSNRHLKPKRQLDPPHQFQTLNNHVIVSYKKFPSFQNMRRKSKFPLIPR